MKTNSAKRMTNLISGLLFLLCGTAALVHYSEWPGLIASLSFALVPIVVNPTLSNR